MAFDIFITNTTLVLLQIMCDESNAMDWFIFVNSILDLKNIGYGFKRQAVLLLDFFQCENDIHW